MSSVPNAENGIKEMESLILAVLDGNLHLKNLLIAMEYTSFYGVHVTNYKKSFTGIGKNDDTLSTASVPLRRSRRLSPNTVVGLDPTEYQILRSILRIGPVYTAGMGSMHCFSSSNALAKYNDIVWRDHQSGEFDADNTPMVKTGNRYLRYYLIQAAGSVTTCCPEYTTYYNMKYAEVLKHQHKRALALTARKLICLIFDLLDNNQLYSAAKSR